MNWNHGCLVRSTDQQEALQNANDKLMEELQFLKRQVRCLWSRTGLGMDVFSCRIQSLVKAVGKNGLKQTSRGLSPVFSFLQVEPQAADPGTQKDTSTELHATRR